MVHASGVIHQKLAQEFVQDRGILGKRRVSAQLLLRCFQS